MAAGLQAFFPGRRELVHVQQKHFATAFDQRTFSLPFVKKAAYSKEREIRGAGQILIRNIQFDPTISRLPANCSCQGSQNVGKPLSCIMANESDVCIPVPCEIVPCYK